MDATLFDLAAVPPVQAFSPELIGLTLTRVPLTWTLFHERSRYLATEGLCGTLDSWTDRLRGNRGSEEGGRAGLYPRCNRATPKPGPRNPGTRRGARKEGPYRAVGPSPVQSIAVSCRAGDVTPRHFLPFRDTSNLRVGGCERRYASQSLRSRRLLANPSRRAIQATDIETFSTASPSAILSPIGRPTRHRQSPEKSR